MGLDPLRADSTEDPDSDGLTNLEEYTHGSNPLLLDSDSDELTDVQEIEIYGNWRQDNNKYFIRNALTSRGGSALL